MSKYEVLYKKYPDHREELEERAGIIEHHGNMQKDEAELVAALVIKHKYNLEEE